MEIRFPWLVLVLVILGCAAYIVRQIWNPSQIETLAGAALFYVAGMWEWVVRPRLESIEGKLDDIKALLEPISEQADGLNRIRGESEYDS